ncbi:uncharacterized protein LOC107805304 [Nicotiana tabacum]|uniref:Uncharacterized protein LOC107805304 n=1 Tax=Nicotiana tabacum TaxID=4097 RepID=A0AC58UIC8_TOBAC
MKSIGFTSWNKKNIFDMHIGGPSYIHNQSRKNVDDLLRQKQSIQSAFAKQSDQQKLEYQTHLEVAAVDVIRYLLTQGLSFRGHREDESFINRGNFIELVKWYTERCKDVGDALKRSPKNNQLSSPYIQKDIIIACKWEQLNVLLVEDLNDNYFSILVDESRDVSCKEQIAIVLRYFDRRGRCDKVQELLLLVSDILNMVGASFKLRDELRESQEEEIEEVLRKDELETCRGLNQELGLTRAGDIQWGSHYKSFNNFILMFGPIIDVLDALTVNAHFEKKCNAKEYL